MRLAVGGGAVASVLAGLGFLGYVQGIDRTERPPESSADAIVALTGGSQRIADAVDLLAQGFGRRLLITGVNERTTREEIADLNPTRRRLLDCCVDLDYRARNTLGNANETRRWSAENGFRSLIVVTSNYHMARTLAEFDHALPGVAKVPHAVVSGMVELDGWWARARTLRLLGFEYAKYLGARVRMMVFRAEAGETVRPSETMLVARSPRAGPP